MQNPTPDSPDVKRERNVTIALTDAEYAEFSDLHASDYGPARFAAVVRVCAVAGLQLLKTKPGSEVAQ